MLTRIHLYRDYRRHGMRRAWTLAGMNSVAWSVGYTLLLAAMLVVAVLGLTSQAQAIQDAADNRVAGRVSAQAGEIQALREIVAKCLGDREGALFIGGELHLCRAVPTGIRL